jgi:hypothetical protein
MKVNRRDFVRVGALGAAGVVATSCGQCGSGPSTPGVAPDTAKGPPTDLTIRIKGLALVHRTPPSLTVHLINGTLVGMPAHLARLVVPATLIDASSTVAHTPHPNDANMRVIDLTNKAVSIPGTGGGAPNIAVFDNPIGSTIPPNANAWRSIRHSAYLPTLTGATTVTDTTKFYGSVVINHADVDVAPPEGLTGNTTIWTFKNPTTSLPVTPPQAVSNVLQCKTKVHAGGPTFTIGSQTLVLVPGQSGVITISNDPVPPPPGPLVPPYACSGGQPVCADHLHVYYDLVNAAVKPIAEGVLPSGSAALTDPNYCPPGFI